VRRAEAVRMLVSRMRESHRGKMADLREIAVDADNALALKRSSFKENPTNFLTFSAR